MENENYEQNQLSEMSYEDSEFYDAELIENHDHHPDNEYDNHGNDNGDEDAMEWESSEQVASRNDENQQNDVLARSSSRDDDHFPEALAYVYREQVYTRNPQEYGDEEIEVDYSQQAILKPTEANRVLAPPKSQNPARLGAQATHRFKRAATYSSNSTMYQIGEDEEHITDTEVREITEEMAERETEDEVEIVEVEDMEQDQKMHSTKSIKEKPLPRQLFYQSQQQNERVPCAKRKTGASNKEMLSNSNSMFSSLLKKNTSNQNTQNQQRNVTDKSKEAQTKSGLEKSSNSMFGLMAQRGIKKTKQQNATKPAKQVKLLPPFNKIKFRRELFNETDPEQPENGDTMVVKLSPSFFHGDHEVEPIEFTAELLEVCQQHLDPTIVCMMKTDAPKGKGNRLKPQNLQPKNFKHYVSARQFDKRTKIDILVVTQNPRIAVYLYHWLKQTKHNMKVVMNCNQLQTKEIGFIAQAKTRTHNLDTLTDYMTFLLDGIKPGLYEKEEWLPNKNKSPSLATVISVEVPAKDHKLAMEKMGNKTFQLGMHYSQLEFIPRTLMQSNRQEYRKLFFKHLNYLKHEETFVVVLHGQEEAFNLLQTSLDSMTEDVKNLIFLGDAHKGYLTFSGHNCHTNNFIEKVSTNAQDQGVQIEIKRMMRKASKPQPLPSAQDETQHSTEFTTPATTTPHQSEQFMTNRERALAMYSPSGNKKALKWKENTHHSYQTDEPPNKERQRNSSVTQVAVQKPTTSTSSSGGSSSASNSTVRFARRPPVPQDARNLAGRGRGRGRGGPRLKPTPAENNPNAPPKKASPQELVQIPKETRIIVPEGQAPQSHLPPQDVIPAPSNVVAIGEDRVVKLIEEKTGVITNRLEKVEGSMANLRQETSEFHANMEGSMSKVMTVAETIRTQANLATQLSLKIKDEVLAKQSEKIARVQTQLRDALFRENKHYEMLSENIQSQRKDILRDNYKHARNIMYMVKEINPKGDPHWSQALKNAETMETNPCPYKVDEYGNRYTRRERNINFYEDSSLDEDDDSAQEPQGDLKSNMEIDVTTEPLYQTDASTITTTDSNNAIPQSSPFANQKEQQNKTPTRNVGKRKVIGDSEGDNSSEDEEKITREIDKAVAEKKEQKKQAKEAVLVDSPMKSAGQIEREKLLQARTSARALIKSSATKRKPSSSIAHKSPVKKGKGNLPSQESYSLSSKSASTSRSSYRSPVQTRAKSGILQPTNYRQLGGTKVKKVATDSSMTTNKAVTAVTPSKRSSMTKVKNVAPIFQKTASASKRASKTKASTASIPSQKTISSKNPTFEEGKDRK